MGGSEEEQKDDPDALGPDRFYVISDAGSVYFDDEHPDGFETAAAAAEWARTQDLWRYGSELDFSDGMTSFIVKGSEVNESVAAWEEWAKDTSQPYPAVEVHNYAIDLGLTVPPEERR